jgi:hypothetical protein
LAGAAQEEGLGAWRLLNCLDGLDTMRYDSTIVQCDAPMQ